MADCLAAIPKVEDLVANKHFSATVYRKANLLLKEEDSEIEL